MTTETPATLDEAITNFCRDFPKLGQHGETLEGGYSIDLNNSILADPYIDCTGWFATREIAEGIAAVLIQVSTMLAEAALAADPELGSGWTRPEEVVDSYAYIVSAERDEWDEPAVFDHYSGDVWFLAGLSMPWTLHGDEKAVADAVNAEIERVLL